MYMVVKHVKQEAEIQTKRRNKWGPTSSQSVPLISSLFFFTTLRDLKKKKIFISLFIEFRNCFSRHMLNRRHWKSQLLLKNKTNDSPTLHLQSKVDCDESLWKQTVTSPENTDPNQTCPGFKPPLHDCSLHGNNNKEESRYLGDKVYEMCKMLKENNKNSIQMGSNGSCLSSMILFSKTNRVCPRMSPRPAGAES